MKLYRYSGAGNSFMVADGRAEDAASLREVAEIQRICSENGTDGLMILGQTEGYDFSMDYFNSDGSGGMMCGNGGRCIVAFAADRGVKPADGKVYRFVAADGEHTGEILSDNGVRKTVRLKMIDVDGIEFMPELKGYFLNTGTRHFVKMVEDVEKVDVEQEGKELRWRSEFAPIGTNVNFVAPQVGGLLHVRTFEKGVEGETLACGTGITASAIAAYHAGVAPATLEGRVLGYDIKARIDNLRVEFEPSPETGKTAVGVYLIGPAEIVA